VVVYYEGNRYGAENLRTYSQRVSMAAGRMFKKYPTIALMGFTREDFCQWFKTVGTIDEDYNMAILDVASVKRYEALYNGQRTA
jgi:hypothetical protein